MIKKISLFFASSTLLFFLAGMAPLWGQTEEQIEKFNKDREAYFIKAIELADAKQFYKTLIPAQFEYGKFLIQTQNPEKGNALIQAASKKARDIQMKSELIPIQEFLAS